MNIDKDLYNELVQRFDDRYVRRTDCNDRHKESDEKVNQMVITQTQNTTQLSLLMKLNIATLLASITALIEQFGHLIFKQP